MASRALARHALGAHFCRLHPTGFPRGRINFLRQGGPRVFTAGGRGVFWGEKRRTTNSAATTFSYTRVYEGVTGGGRRGVLATPSYTLVYEKVVAAELVVRRFSPQNTPLPPAVKTAGPPWRKKLILPRGNPVGWGLQKCAPSACRAGAREAMHLVCTHAQNASRCRQAVVHESRLCEVYAALEGIAQRFKLSGWLPLLGIAMLAWGEATLALLVVTLSTLDRYQRFHVTIVKVYKFLLVSCRFVRNRKHL
jgi:hypothetical protein